MTYIEKALYDFVRTIATRGIKTLTDAKYLPYSLFLLVVVGISTIAAFLDDLTGIAITPEIKDVLLYVELSTALAFLFVGLILGKLRLLFQVVVMFVITGGLTFVLYTEILGNASDLAMLAATLLYVLWIIVASFSTFSLFRDLFENDVFGLVLFLGKPEDDGRPMFSLIAWILIFVNIGLGVLIYQNGTDQQSTALVYSGIIIIFAAIIATFPLFNVQRKYDVFYTIITTFYMFTTIRIAILAFKSLTNTPGQTSIWDTIFSLFIALYAIQSAAVKGIKIGEADLPDLSVEEKMMAKEKGNLGFSKTVSRLIGDKGIVLSILGLVIGYHSLQIQSFLGRQNIFNDFEYTADADIILIGYEVNLAVSFLIYILAILAFLLIPAFRRYANPTVRRIVWAPEYGDLKLLAIAVKEGDINWKTEAMGVVTSLGASKIKGLVGSGGSFEEKISEKVGDLVEKAKDKRGVS
ncbi:MAG: hypothetical protein ACXAE3_10040 [Candidatus Kariarchaeaceae archaeon]|jgi:hypothetical protein